MPYSEFHISRYNCGNTSITLDTDGAGNGGDYKKTTCLEVPRVTIFITISSGHAANAQWSAKAAKSAPRSCISVTSPSWDLRYSSHQTSTFKPHETA